MQRIKAEIVATAAEAFAAAQFARFGYDVSLQRNMIWSSPRARGF
jgi:hypothetical protein